MKLILTLLVRDEEDILRENILFHLNHGVDFIIATDNKSVDGTKDILKAYEQRGVLKYIFEPGDDYSQWKWVTRMARMAATNYQADWVINADADEFWYPSDGSLKDALAEIPDDVGAVSVDRNNFATVERKHSEFYKDMIYRETKSFNSLGEPLPAKVCHRALPDAVVEQGNHHISQPTGLQKISTPKIKILHFPLRSFTQFENKIKLGGASLERNNELDFIINNTWRKLYEDYKNGGLSSYYKRQELSNNAISKGLSDGSLMLDTRLKDFFCSDLFRSSMEKHHPDKKNSGIKHFLRRIFPSLS
jgi:hypothetical protein